MSDNNLTRDNEPNLVYQSIKSSHFIYICRNQMNQEIMWSFRVKEYHCCKRSER